MKDLTIRNLPDEVATALKDEKRRRGDSMNQTLTELLSQELEVGEPRSNGMARLAGFWSEDEFREFEAAVSGVERIDEELWR